MGTIITKNGLKFNAKSIFASGVEVEYQPQFLQDECFPQVNKFLKFNENANGYELLLGEEVISIETSEFFGEYLASNNRFTDTGIFFDLKTKEIRISDGFDIFELFPGKKVESVPSYYDAINFFLAVTREVNPYVYMLFTKVNNKSKKFASSVWHPQRYFILENFVNNISNIGNIEKIVKTFGEDFFFTNFNKEGFNLNEAKKINKVIDMPVAVANGIAKLKLEPYYKDFKDLAAINPNYAVTLIEFLSNFRKVFKAVNSTTFDMGLLAKELLEILAYEEYKNSFNSILNYLVNENFNYSVIKIPSKEAQELKDYIGIVSAMKENDEEFKFDKFPRNLKKVMNVVNQNNVILTNPRPDEFISATQKYSFVEDSTDDNFVFLRPKDEHELLKEGNMLHHCVASYRDKIIDSGVVVVLMRKKGEESEPFVTIEYLKGLPAQIKEKYNQDVTDAAVLDAALRWSIRARKRERN